MPGATASCRKVNGRRRGASGPGQLKLLEVPAMKSIRLMVLSAGLVVSAAASAQAQTATQDITVNVQAINKIAISGGAHTMTINTATAGQAPDDVTWGTTWAITTNQTGSKVVASIGTDMPTGVTLKVNMAE